MQVLLPNSFSFPKPLNPNNYSPRHSLLSTNPSSSVLPSKCFSSDEFPIDETFAKNFGITTTRSDAQEEEWRRKNWIERGWAPWEEILTPEADFARKSLNEPEEAPLQSPEAIEAFKMLNPSYRLQKIHEMGLTEDEWYKKQFDIKGEIPDPLETTWAGPLVLRHVPPRDWPPRDWEVDREELEFIRESHKMMSERVVIEEMDSREKTDTEKMSYDRYKMFLKQYNEWVIANKDRLEKESFEHDQDYFPGRRKRGEEYKEGMYELPFYYPGQICEGQVTTIHLYQGAFVDIGGVHDGWVPIKRNDWFWIRHHIKVGMHVIVEILAKRDPYRFRFPIEMRFIWPNIDHLIFNKFDFPPIFHRDEDTNPDEVRRDCGRPPDPRKDPETKPEEEPLLSNHPYVEKLWLIHNAEQMIVDDWELNPDKYKGKKISELTDDEDFDEQNSVEYAEAYFKKALLPKTIMKQSVKELDLEAALAERQFHNKLRAEAIERGEKYKIDNLRRTIEMDEYDLIHWRRSFEEREALIRDISCRKALGLPLEEPGRYKPTSYFGKDQYDPENPLYRYDYWGEPKSSEKSKQERMRDAHNKSIVGKGTVWYEMSYEEAIKQRMKREARAEELKQKGEDQDLDKDPKDEEDDSDDDDIWDYSFLSDMSNISEDQPLVNGTKSSGLSDEGLFEK
ncbi:protein PLASTID TRANSCRIPTIONALLY ACTIVE 10 [Mercurialis annua]|uniref:protein PLASTID TRANSCRIPTIONALLY ACTIVE 10 n=1 Tax=Mercurialis annua TaxID=3986 RepID=UPI002160CDE2|nr:protein PLASTID TRANSCRIPTIONALLY ACTIVE 10 [Mercurialis annua]